MQAEPTISQILFDVFGYSQFREGQQAVIEHLCNGQDALVVMPTGGVKVSVFKYPHWHERVSVLLSRHLFH